MTITADEVLKVLALALFTGVFLETRAMRKASLSRADHDRECSLRIKMLEEERQDMERRIECLESRARYNDTLPPRNSG